MDIIQKALADLQAELKLKEAQAAELNQAVGQIRRAIAALGSQPETGYDRRKAKTQAKAVAAAASFSYKPMTLTDIADAMQASKAWAHVVARRYFECVGRAEYVLKTEYRMAELCEQPSCTD